MIIEAKRECAAASPAIEAAHRMKECPFGLRVLKLAPNVISTLLPDTQDTRVVVNLLQWDVVLAVEAGDTARAADSIQAMLAVSRSLRIVCRMIATRSLEWTLPQTELPADRLKEFQTAWSADAEEPLLLFGLRGERASMDVLMGNLTDGTADPATWQEVGEKHRGTLNEFGWWWCIADRVCPATGPA